jgi:hypothetical protein
LDRNTRQVKVWDQLSPWDWPWDTVRLEILTAVTVKNTVLWDIKTQFIPQGDTLLLNYIAQPVNVM